MRYFMLTAYTPYCGEELISFEVAESEKELYLSGKVDDLINDCIDTYMDYTDHENDGFESEEAWDEYYREGSGIEIVEISKKSYEDYARD